MQQRRFCQGLFVFSVSDVFEDLIFYLPQTFDLFGMLSLLILKQR